MRIPDATERNVLIRCAFAGGLLCLAPGDVASMGLLWLIALGLYLWHRKLLRLEGATATAAVAVPTAAATAAAAAPAPPPSEAPTEEPDAPTSNPRERAERATSE